MTSSVAACTSDLAPCVRPAGWGAGEDLQRSEREGFLLGRSRSNGRTGSLLRYGGAGHLLTFAPTRAGKGMGALMPNLLTHPGSVVVLDPKGENFAVTAERRNRMGQQVVVLDPFDVTDGYAYAGALNPLEMIDPTSPDAVDDATALADMLVCTQGPAMDGGYWDTEARALIAGLILHVCQSHPRGSCLRNLAEVRRLLTLSREEFATMSAEMDRSANTFVQRSADRHAQKESKEASGVLSTAQAHTHFLDSQRIAGVMGSTTFDLARLKTRGDLSLYLVLPPERIGIHRGWLRLVLWSVLTTLTRTPGAPERRVLLLLDEVAQLGRIDLLYRLHSLLAGYGATFWLFFQDLAQLSSTYPAEWQSFVSNSAVLQAFNVNDTQTAELVAGKLRGLMEPADVLGLDPRTSLLVRNGRPPVAACKLDYRRDREFEGRFQPNPLYVRTAARMAAI